MNRNTRQSNGLYAPNWQKYIPVSVLLMMVAICLVLSRTQAQADLFVQPDTQPSKPQATPVPKTEHDRLEFTREDAYQYVWMRESSKGTNNPVGSNAQLCYQKGLFNEIGASGTKHSICFKDRDEQEQFFYDWLDKNLDGLKIQEALCTWNVGPHGDMNCEYGKTFKIQHTHTILK